MSPSRTANLALRKKGAKNFTTGQTDRSEEGLR